MSGNWGGGGAGGAGLGGAHPDGHRLRSVTLGGKVSLLSGGDAGYLDAQPPSARFSLPRDIVFAPKVGLYVVEESPGRIRRVALPNPCDDGDPCTLDACTGPMGRCKHTKVAGCQGWEATACKAETWPTTRILGGNAGVADGGLAAARFTAPMGLARDGRGGLYVADTGNHRVRHILGEAVSTFAGSAAGFADGPAQLARFTTPTAVASAPDRPLLVADSGNRRVRAVADGVVFTLAGSGGVGSDDGPATKATFTAPRDVRWYRSVDAVVIDSGAHRVRLIKASGQVSTLAGSTAGFADGPAAKARFSTPSAVAVDGDVLYIADRGNRRIRRLSAGVVSTLAGSGQSGDGDGVGAQAAFRAPSGIGVSVAGLFVVDAVSSVLRHIDRGGRVTTIVGSAGKSGITDGSGAKARLSAPAGVVALSAADIIVADTGNHALRHVRRATVCDDDSGCTLETCVAGKCKRIGLDGCIGQQGGTYCTDDKTCSDGDPCTKDLCDLNYRRCANPAIDKCVHPQSKVVYCGAQRWLVKAVAPQAKLGTLSVQAMAVTPAGPVGTMLGGATGVMRLTIDGQPGATALAGGKSGSCLDGKATNARFKLPVELVWSASRGVVVTDLGCHALRTVSADGTVTTYAGKLATEGAANGSRLTARFNQPYGLTVGPDDALHVTEQAAHAVRRIDKAGKVTLFAGGSSAGFLDGPAWSARFNLPRGLAGRADGALFVVDRFNHAIRRIHTVGGKTTVTTLAGGSAGKADGIGPTAAFSDPVALAFDPLGGLLVVEGALNPVVRRVMPDGTVTTVVGGGTGPLHQGVGRDARFASPRSIIAYKPGRLLLVDQGVVELGMSVTCDDKNPCTLDTCSGTPPTCHHKPIAGCSKP